MWLTSGEVAKREDVTRQTIHRWVKRGLFDRVKTTKLGQFRIWVDDDAFTILYGRVDLLEDTPFLETQEKLLKRSYPDGEYISDIASGFNFERQGFRSILERAVQKTPIKLVATTQDRITRTGFGLIKWLIELGGGSIEFLEKGEDSEDFDPKEIVGLLSSFVDGKGNTNQ